MSEKKKGGIKRRDFLKIIGVAGGTAAVAGACSSEPVDQIIPYVIPPEDLIPGIPKWFASTCTECSAGCGIVVKNREGRAIKVEGNPKNPINAGTLCAMGQASLQGLYNPDRTRSPLAKNASGKHEPIKWDAAEKTLADRIKKLQAEGKSDKIVFLTNSVSGSMEKLIKSWLAALGGGGSTVSAGVLSESEGLTESGLTQVSKSGKHITYETFAHEPIAEANRISFGLAKIPTYNLEKAKYILSFGADFLETWLSPTEYAAKFTQSHSYRDGSMGKLVQVEPRTSLAGVNADEWVAIKPGADVFLALAVANVIVSEGLNSSSVDEAIRTLLGNYDAAKASTLTGVSEDKIRQIAKEFASAPSIAIGGGAATTATNATETLVAINILNYVAGNIGDTLDFAKSLTITDAASFRDMGALAKAMSAGDVELLLVSGVNPLFTLPKSLKFDEAMKRVPYVVSFSSFMDETAAAAHLILPDITNLERWGDYAPRDGVYGLIQPAMNTVNLFNAKPMGDVMLSVSKQIDSIKEGFAWKDFYEYLRDEWKNSVMPAVAPGSDFDSFWAECVQNGGIYREPAPIAVSLSSGVSDVAFPPARFEGAGDVYFVAYPSSRYYDGRGANKPWLQELPDPITTAVWDSWAEIHPDMAHRLGVEEGDFLSIESPYGKIETQAFVYKGVRPDTIAVPIGLGHKNYGRYAENVGVNPIEILPSAVDERSGGFAWLSAMVKVSKTGKSKKLVKTQYTLSQFDRKIAQSTTLAEIKGGHHGEHHEEIGEGGYGLYKPHEHINYRWGMTIDLSKCTGCGSCVTACYAENNIAIVGKDQVSRGRYMGWLRIERFFEDTPDGGFDTKFLPMLCQHCDNAPCEPVCPVYATYHNHEGLNVMVYNRCVGTRYCSNNCTYKVRRFNWYMYKWAEPLNWQLNPDVTVRSVGVMEKCTFCSHRIVQAKDHAKDEGRLLRDGEFNVACAQACASKAIVFGNLMDSESAVSRSLDEHRGYHVLNEVNTKPSITYLKKVKQDRA
ncbi:MAG: molybdopterin-dependent oxidoreductase [Deltaproteobacteria bacterium]